MMCLLSLAKTRESLFLLLGLVFSFVSFPALAANYTAYPGSRINIQSVSQTFAGADPVIVTANPKSSQDKPLLGAVIMNIDNFYHCSSAASVIKVDGFTGVKLNDNSIIAGVTGAITGGIGHYKPKDSAVWIPVSGGLLFNESGEPSPIGSAAPRLAQRLCGGSDEIRAGDKISSPANSELDNKYANVNLTAWIYIPKTVTPGLYSLNKVSLAQGIGTNIVYQQAIIPIINSGETIEVLPPPCTIATQTSIKFDTTLEEGMKVSAPVAFKCENVIIPTAVKAYLQVKSVGSTRSDTELNMMINGEAVGGVVRGYAGKDLELSQANCTNNTHSLSFSKPSAIPFGTVTTGNQQQLPLVWQLCRTGNEQAGKATGSALLDIIYK